MPLQKDRINMIETFLISCQKIGSYLVDLEESIRLTYVGKCIGNTFIIGCSIPDPKPINITAGANGNYHATVPFCLETFVIGQNDILLNCEVKKVDNNVIMLTKNIEINAIMIEIRIQCMISTDQIMTHKVGDLLTIQVNTVHYWPMTSYIGVVGVIRNTALRLPFFNVTNNLTAELLQRLKNIWSFPIPNGSNIASQLYTGFGQTGEQKEGQIIIGPNSTLEAVNDFKTSAVYMDLTDVTKLVLYRVKAPKENYIDSNPDVGMAFAVDSYCSFLSQLQKMIV